jgi:plastocyanin
MTVIRIRNVVLAVLLLGVVTACGSSSSGGQKVTPGSGSSSPAASGNAITIKGFAFHPSTLTVKVGTKVTFTNEDGVTHTATGSGNASIINSGNLTHGQSYTVTFTKPGTYNYICSIHQYMKGTVIVQ